MMAEVTREPFDHGVTRLLQLLRAVEQGQDTAKHVKDIKGVIQTMYTAFVSVYQQHQVSHQRTMTLAQENQELRRELTDLYQFRGQYNEHLQEALAELTSVAHDQEPADPETQKATVVALKSTQEQFLDNQTWQAKLHRAYQENMELRDNLDRFHSDQVHLNETIDVLKTELCGRIQQVQLMSQGLATTDNPTYTRLLSEMQQNTMRAVANAESRRKRMSKMQLIEQQEQQQQEQQQQEQQHHERQQGQQQLQGEDSAAVEKNGALMTRYRRSVRLEKAATGGFGLRIQGGALDDNPSAWSPVAVEKVYPLLSAHESGRVFVGDEILAINSTPVARLCHSDVIRLIQESGNAVVLDLASTIKTEDDDTHTEETTAVAPSRAARQLLEQGRCEDVVRMTTRAIHDDPTALLAFALRAKAHLALGQLEDAEKDCQAVLSQRVVPGPIYTLSCVYEKQGRLELAREFAAFACRVDRDNVTFRTHLRHIQHLMKEREREEVGDMLQTLLSRAVATASRSGSRHDLSPQQQQNQDHANPASAPKLPRDGHGTAPGTEGATDTQQQREDGAGDEEAGHLHSAPQSGSGSRQQSSAVSPGPYSHWALDQQQQQQQQQRQRRRNRMIRAVPTQSHQYHGEEEEDEDMPLYTP